MYFLISLELQLFLAIAFCDFYLLLYLLVEAELSRHVAKEICLRGGVQEGLAKYPGLFIGVLRFLVF
jgi:hypothetical protein